MDDTWQIIAIGLILALLPAVVVGIKRRLGMGRKKTRILVTCPHCGRDVGLDRLRNYICGHCKRAVAFFDLQTGRPLPEAEQLTCGQCGQRTFKGPHTCHRCGAKLDPPVRQ